jgi:hypothetical protein
MKTQFGLDDIRDLISNSRRTMKGGGPTRFEGINETINKGYTQPLRSLGELTGVADAYRGVSPGASIGQQALGLASILTPLAAQEEAVMGASRLASEMAKRAATAKYKAGNELGYMFGKTVVHGSPERGLKYIDPTFGSKALPDQEVAFSWNPKAFGNTENLRMKERAQGLADAAYEYITPKDYMPMDSSDIGSYYVGKMKRGSEYPLSRDFPGSDMARLMTVTEQPIKVIAEIPAYLGTEAEQTAALGKALRRGGVRPFVPDRVLDLSPSEILARRRYKKMLEEQGITDVMNVVP